LVIAGGKKLYIDMACNLAMSFMLWNRDSGIQFFLVTDRPDYIPDQLKKEISVIEKTPAELNKGFSSKLQIGDFLQTKQTLFIDADCLVYGELNSVFDLFKGRSLSVIGYNRTEGIDTGFCKDIRSVMQKTRIDYYTMLCGSIYYVEKNDTSRQAFNYANELLASYDEIGLIRLRNRENEEPLIAIAMAKYRQQPVNDPGFVKGDRMYYDHLKSNILNGYARLWSDKEPPVPVYSTLMESEPLIVHYNASYNETFEYKSEVARIRKVYLEEWPKALANSYANLIYTFPGKIIKSSKNLLRPLYNTLFGFRKIKPSERIITE
jgi:hypothetical protein